MTGRSRHDELRALAEAATPGPWQVDNDPKRVTQTDHAGPFTGLSVAYTNASGTNPQAVGNAAYIAAVSPDVLLALLDEVAAAEARAELAELEIRLREQSQIPVIPRAAQERLAAAEARAADAERERDESRRMNIQLRDLSTEYSEMADAERARADKATEALALMVEAVERHADPTDPKHKRRLIQSPRLQEAMALARAALADLAASGEAQR